MLFVVERIPYLCVLQRENNNLLLFHVDIVR
jgi:hypothetical protein